MLIKYITLVGVFSLLVACGECNAPAQKVETKDPQCSHFMTNDEIIAETTKCNSAGLDAQDLHCGDDHQTVIVQCKPRTMSGEENGS